MKHFIRVSPISIYQSLTNNRTIHCNIIIIGEIARLPRIVKVDISIMDVIARDTHLFSRYLPIGMITCFLQASDTIRLKIEMASMYKIAGIIPYPINILNHNSPKILRGMRTPRHILIRDKMLNDHKRSRIVLE